MAEASVGLMSAPQFGGRGGSGRGGSGRGGRRGMVRGGRNTMSGSRMRMDNMHDDRVSFDRIQSRPMVCYSMSLLLNTFFCSANKTEWLVSMMDAQQWDVTILLTVM
jgi:hypothetical protein